MFALSNLQVVKNHSEYYWHVFISNKCLIKLLKALGESLLKSYRQDGEWALQTAIRNVDKHYLVVGVTEQFGDFVGALEHMLPSYFKGGNQFFQREGKGISFQNILFQNFNLIFAPLGRGAILINILNFKDNAVLPEYSIS